ncbi:MAG: hypothetical protein SGI89_13555 [bacterium]|nr:hypothetical protein [bacterium]
MGNINIVNDEQNPISVKIFYDNDKQHDPDQPDTPKPPSPQVKPINVPGKKPSDCLEIAKHRVKEIVVNNKFSLKPKRVENEEMCKEKIDFLWTDSSRSINVVAHEMSDVVILEINNRSKKDTIVDLELIYVDNTSEKLENIGNQLYHSLQKELKKIIVISDNNGEMDKSANVYKYKNDEKGIEIEAIEG